MSSTDQPAFRYTAAFADTIERRWQERWAKDGTYVVRNPGEPGFDASRPKYYCLDMFPYPSGAGLHVGHPEGYTATDIICRYKRMKGFNVLHPMGWDAFGLPAEQYAIQTGVHPAITTRNAIDNFRRQLQRFGFSYDWSREFGTIDPEYYTWTQWIFLKLYDAWFDESMDKARTIAELEQEFASGAREVRPNPRAEETPERPLGAWARLDAGTRRRILDSYRLAYQSTTTVNWCPKLGTVLANDEVIDGKSERGGHPVLRRPLKQWMFRITAYADRLRRQLDDLDWPESTKTMQREWIGRSEGAEIDFLVVGRLSEPTPPSPHSPASSSSHPADTQAPFTARTPSFIPRNPYPPGEPSPADLLVQIKHLPHLELDQATYFVTWRTEGRRLNAEGRDVVMKSLLHFDGDRVDVLAASVMETHVHWLVKPRPGHRLGELVLSVKRFSATQVNRIEATSGSLWQPEHFDHIVRDEQWLGAFCAYIAQNPVEAGLVTRCAAYAWTYISGAMRTTDGSSLGLGVGRWRNAAGGCGGVGSESQPTGSPKLRVFTTRPDTLFGATYIVVAPEHPLVDQILRQPADRTDSAALHAYVRAVRDRSDVERQEAKEKTGVELGVDAINPATGKPIPIWVADYVLMGYGTGAIMAVPGGDERDHEFATMFKLPIVEVVVPHDEGKRPEKRSDATPVECYPGEGRCVNSSNAELSLDGLATPDAKREVIAWLERRGLGARRVNYKLRDWTFSRQRYWGEPFPIVFDREGHAYPIQPSHLPVKLPELADYAPVESNDPQPLLAKAKDWAHTTAGQAGVSPELLAPDTPVTRETNTMPGSAGSSWYAIRYCDARNNQRLVGVDAERYWMSTGVDLYLGGSEHAVGHLLYARFWQNVLYDLGHVSCKEPFRKLFHQGLITSFAYQRADKTLVPVDQVEERTEGAFVEKATGARVTQIAAKMSKSLKNVVNPDDVIAEFGADTFRLYEMYMGPLDASKPWNPRDISGLFRFLQRAWRLGISEDTGSVRAAPTPDASLDRQLHRLIAKVGADIERLAFNTAIAAMIELVNAATSADKGSGPLTRDQLGRFALVLAPFAPHMAQELWHRLGHAGAIAHEPWPVHDPAKLVDQEVELPVSIQGKVRSRIVVPAGADAKAIEAAALADPKVREQIEGKAIKKVIVVPGKMVNVVV